MKFFAILNIKVLYDKTISDILDLRGFIVDLSELYQIPAGVYLLLSSCKKLLQKLSLSKKFKIEFFQHFLTERLIMQTHLDMVDVRGKIV